MKRIMSMFLVLVLLFLCAPIQSNAIVPGEDSMDGLENTSTLTIDELFAERARLLLDPNTTQEQLDNIDTQLFNLGVEEISAAEVAAKYGTDIQPMIDVSSTSDTRWYSSRQIVVVWGQQYEAQTIIGQWTSSQSPLTKTYNVYRYYDGANPANLKALQIVVENIVAYGAGQVVPYMDEAITFGLTLRDLWDLAQEAQAPYAFVENVDYSSLIQMGTTVKLVYVKYSGSPDEGYQVLCYVGTDVNCNVTISIPIYEIVNGVQKMDTAVQQFSCNVKSNYYDSAESFAANNRRLIYAGATEIDTRHQISSIPITILDEVFWANVPFAYF